MCSWKSFSLHVKKQKLKAEQSAGKSGESTLFVCACLCVWERETVKTRHQWGNASSGFFCVSGFVLEGWGTSGWGGLAGDETNIQLDLWWKDKQWIKVKGSEKCECRLMVDALWPAEVILCRLGRISVYFCACIMLTQHSERRRLRTLMEAPCCFWTLLKTTFHHFPPCVLTDVTWRDRTVCANWKRGGENVGFYLFSCLHLLFFSDCLQTEIHLLPLCVFSNLCFEYLNYPLCWKTRKPTSAASPTFSHTPINLWIDSSLHFHTAWAELKRNDSFRCVHCFSHASVVYNGIGVLQTTPAQLRSWMYSAQCVVHSNFWCSSLFMSCVCDSPTSFSYSWWSFTTVYPCRINFISL